MLVKIKAPAKINLFLRVLGKRSDGYHNIRSGIVLINLFDEMSIKESNRTFIKYYGDFKPVSGVYPDCIIKKTLEFLNLYKRVNLEIKIKKNIPVKGGLGSASTNAATLIKALKQLNIIQKINKDLDYSIIGADVPFFLFSKGYSLVQGIGQNITNQITSKHFFLLIKPSISFSTKSMYQKVSKKLNKNLFIDDNDWGNDFEKIAVEKNQEIKNLLTFLQNSENCVFSRMTGTGSCCFGAFKELIYANKAQKEINKKYPGLWSNVVNNYF